MHLDNNTTREILPFVSSNRPNLSVKKLGKYTIRGFDRIESRNSTIREMIYPELL